MDLDPKAKALLTAIAAAAVPSIESVPLNVAREMVENGMSRMRIPVCEIGSIRNISIDSSGRPLNLRLYTPVGEGPHKTIIFFHGGGWVFFNTASYDPICSHLCRETGCMVVSVDYRLSPESKFPAAINDCYAATLWIVQNLASLNGDPGSLFLAGDSAGGNLAAVTALRIRDEGGPSIKGQVLIYPVTDHYKRKKQSAITFAEGFNLSDEDMHWFWNHYLENEEDGDNPMASPLIAENLTNLPPALMIVSGHDPLRDEGLEYARKLTEAGVPVEVVLYEEMIHGFISYLGILRQGLEAIREISVWVKNREE